MSSDKHKIWDTLDDIERYYGRRPNSPIWRRRRMAYIGVGLFLLAAIIIIPNLAEKDIMLEWGKIKNGDKLYANEYYLTDTINKVFSFRRLIRPITAADIERMNISVAEKRKLYTQLDTFNTKSLMFKGSDSYIYKNTMLEKGTSCIGTLVKKDSIAETFEDKFEKKWFAIKPNLKIMTKGFVFKIPQGYILADSNYYIEPHTVKLTEAEVMTRPFVQAADSSHHN